MYPDSHTSSFHHKPGHECLGMRLQSIMWILFSIWRRKTVWYTLLGISVYLPSHEDAIRTLQFLVGKVICIEGLQELCKRRELPPVFLVHLLWCIPLPGQEGVPPANYLSLKECGEGWVLLEEGGGRKEREVGKGGKLEVVKIFIWNWPVCKHIQSLEPRLSVPSFILQLFGFEASIFSSSGLRVCYPTPGKFSALRWILDRSRPKDTSFLNFCGRESSPPLMKPWMVSYNG